jgi:hypothetical protein
MGKAHYLGQLGFFNLNTTCITLRKAFGPCIYLVGSSLTKLDYRDVDVRAILQDAEYDRLFPAAQKSPHWDAQFNLFCASISEWLVQRTGLPIDFQFQRMTDANAEFSGERNALGVNYDVGVEPV